MEDIIDFIEIDDSEKKINYFYEIPNQSTDSYSNEYNELKISLIATYGSNSQFIDVSDIILSLFRLGDIIFIRRENAFNDFFGDPHFGIVKQLIINVNGSIYYIDENRPLDIMIDLETGNMVNFDELPHNIEGYDNTQNNNDKIELLIL